MTTAIRTVHQLCGYCDKRIDRCLAKGECIRAINADLLTALKEVLQMDNVSAYNDDKCRENMAAIARAAIQQAETPDGAR